MVMQPLRWVVSPPPQVVTTPLVPRLVPPLVRPLVPPLSCAMQQQARMQTSCN